MATWELAIVLIIAYIGVFGIINRICTCVERCHMTDNYSNTVVPGEKDNGQNK